MPKEDAKKPDPKKAANEAAAKQEVEVKQKAAADAKVTAEAAAEAARKAADEAARATLDSDEVMANVPKAFTLSLSHQEKLNFKPGAQKMKKAHAEHWYAKAHGVEIVLRPAAE